ncbi:MAG: ferritin-like domain-containing protein, partial [Pseudomonadota bacterium]|nr:ferritin-like domain-containing protein [Pseudomonadota bacterium]
TDERWDLKLIGMQIIIEGLALAAFNTAKAVTPDPVFRDVLHLVIRDEARHVTFGVNYLEDFIENLSEKEREDRAMFAYEACVISKERLFPTDVFRKFGWNENEAREFSNNAGFAQEFQRLLFSRVVPNLSRIGLLTDKVRPLYDKLGVLEFESHTAEDISWAELEKPLDQSA